MPGAGLEPARLLRTQDFESSASTNSATRALRDAKVVKKYLYLQIMEKAFESVRIETGERITDVAPLLEGYGNIYVIYDLGAEQFVKQLCDSDTVSAVTALALEGGEGVKTLETAGKICSWLMDAGADRDALLLIVGGGATSDVSAFAATVYKRGIRFAIIPTTLLAQVDAAIGGKNAVNLGGVKNVIGAIRQPEFTFICPGLLTTLPEKEFLSGVAELLKTLIISGNNYDQAVRLLSAAKDGSMEEKVDAIKQQIPEAAGFKASIVEKDPLDKAERQVLNLGHTFGHAIEAQTGMTHGESVGIGIIMAAPLAEKLGLAVKGLPEKLAEDFTSVGLQAECPVIPSSLKRYMKQDKKASAGKIRFILPVAIGRTAEVCLTADEAINLLPL